MGLCASCKDFFAPTLMVQGKDNDKLCIFCQRDVDTIHYGEGKQKKITRSEAAEEYKLFLKILKEKPNIARAISDKSKEEDLIKLI